MSDFKVVHIVRRYGLVGGMEGYVWELTHALTDLGLEVEVICEQIYGSPSTKIQINTVKTGTSSPRWKAMLRFRAEVNKLISEKHFDQTSIIHSHERSLNHNVTTFHGAPLDVKNNWWRFSHLSARIAAWKQMEKDEILGPQVQVVLPVSNRIKDQLVSLYPKIHNKHVVTAYPGVHPLQLREPSGDDDQYSGSRFVFIGKEWKRKGLRFAIDVIEEYSSQFKFCTMDIYGPRVSDLPRSLRQHPKLVCKGWSKDIPWSNYDALIHPATSEPFGMVVPEARSNGVPVLTTDLVGSIELNYQGVIALDTSDNIKTWAINLANLVNEKENKNAEIKWTWRQLALKHLHEIYPLATQSLG